MGTPNPVFIRSVFCEAFDGVEGRIYNEMLARLNSRCDELGIRQQELGLMLGVDQGTANRYLSGKINFPARRLVSLLLRLNLNPNILHSANYNRALLKAHRAAVIEVRKQQDDTNDVSITEQEMAFLLEVVHQVPFDSITDEIADKATQRVCARLSLIHI